MKIVEQTPRMVFLQSGENYFIMAKGNAPMKYDSPQSTPCIMLLSKAGRLRAVDRIFCAPTASMCFTRRPQRGVFWASGLFPGPGRQQLEIYAGPGAKKT